MINFSNYKSIIFDFDGTLADSLPIHKKAFETTLEKWNDNYPFDYSEYLGLGTEDVIKQYFDKNKITYSYDMLQQYVMTKKNLAYTSYLKDLKAVDGAISFLHQMVDLDKKVYIGSSGSNRNILLGLQSLNIDSLFYDIISADDVKKTKPDPEVYQILIDRHSLPLDETLVVEDSSSGVEAALLAGLTVNSIDSSFKPLFHSDEKVFFYTFEELKSML
jgi:beta-phosphoglucomutase